MAEMGLADILNDCINRLAAGQSLDECLGVYPGQAARLGSMLETGLLVRRMEYGAAEAALAQETIWLRMEQAYNAPAPARHLRLPRRWLWLVAAVIGLLLMSGVILAAQNSRPGEPLYGVKVFLEAIGGGANGAPIPLLPVPTATPSATPTAAPTNTATSAASSTWTLTAMPTLTETPTAEGVTGVIEGPVDAINGNTITIYGMDITIEPDDPLLAVIQVGDAIRVEGDFTAGGAIGAANVTVVETEPDVFVNDEGEQWRDDGTCDNPPPDWAPAHGWRQRCAGGDANVPPGSRGMGNGNESSGNSGNSGGMGMGN